MCLFGWGQQRQDDRRDDDQGGGDTNKTFQFISKKIAVGSDTQPKKFYRLDVGYRGNKPSNVAYSTEGSSFIDNVPAESGQKVSVVFRGLKKNNLQVKICLLYTSPSPRDKRGAGWGGVGL